MKWSSVKTMLLALLIVMNGFVLGVLAVKRADSEKIPPVVRSAALEALENNGIICGEGLLPEKYLTMRSFSGSYPTATELSRMFFGEQLAFHTENRTLIARNGGAELRIEGERFSYKATGEAVPADEKALRKVLRGLGFDLGRARYMAERGEFRLYYENRPVFGAYIKASLDRGGNLVSVEAMWPVVDFSERRLTGISIIGCIPEMLDKFPPGTTLTGIEAGYRPVKDEDTGVYTFEPAWRITAEGGLEEIFDFS